MNSKEAKKIKIVDFFKSQDIFPQKKNRYVFWFLSPLHNEKTASFKVDIYKNIWYDHGIGKGGKSIIDLCMFMHNVNVSEALKIISKLNISENTNSNSFSFQKQKSNTKGIKIKHIQTVKNKALIQYLEKRKISLNIAQIYLKEVYYVVNGKEYFALGFENDKGGFELRNKYFKTSSSPKNYRSININNNSLNIFEGFFDFLTALEYFKTKKPNNDTIILNSVANLKNILPKLKAYKKINLFLDNDNAGKEAMKTIKNHNQNVFNHATLIYPNHNDFNEYFTSN